MRRKQQKLAPGRVRDAIVQALSESATALTPKQIGQLINEKIGDTPMSSVRSYLRLNTPELFVREERGVYRVRKNGVSIAQRQIPGIDAKHTPFIHGRATLIHADCMEWLESQKDCSIHAVVTDPPYGLHEYSENQQSKLRNGKGGVWRIPPSFDGHTRSPLPRFTTLTDAQLRELETYFFLWGKVLLQKLVPGANVIVAANPLLSFVVSNALDKAGLERRGEIVRLVMTMRGGDRPKAAHEEFSGVSVMPRSMWEPWILFRKPIEGRVQDNLRKWKAGGFRRPSKDKPFGDVIKSAPAHAKERALAPHPSLKPQAFLREIVRGALPLGKGVIVDPFAGSGSTLAAADTVGYQSIGIERDEKYF
ncbi:MAG: DNA methyltransferase [Candidatus Hydrogenedentes bacterium]|nr:DNA methyltransferase [Candidatus Hydrogenedentota bacterium]